MSFNLNNVKNKSATSGNFNLIAKATKADKGILRHVKESLSSGVFKELDIDLLEDFPNHKFKLYTDEELKALSDNIKMIGLLDPITVWQTKEGNYYILCGHNRVRACKMAGLKTVTCNVKDYENEEIAKLAVIASNIDRRGGFECLSIGEKISVVKEDFDTLKKLYKEDKEKYGIAAVIGFDAKEEVAVHYRLGSSQANIYYQIGKTFKNEWLELIPKHFNIKAAYVLSQLKKETLTEIMKEIIDAKSSEDNYVVKISDSKAKEIKQMENENVEVDAIISSLYSVKKKDNHQKYTIDFTSETYSPIYKKIQKLDDNIINSIISKALQDYINKQQL